MDKASWVIDEGQIKIKSHLGDISPLTALQVYSAIFSEVIDFHGHQLECPLPTAFPDLIFSRFSAEPVIRIRNLDPSSIFVEVGVWTDNGYCDLPTDYDQIIFSGKWYPISAESIQSAKTWLVNIGVVEKSSISFGKLIELRSSKEIPAKLIDESVIFASDVAFTTH
jgi:hypothetical protein